MNLVASKKYVLLNDKILLHFILIQEYHYQAVDRLPLLFHHMVKKNFK